MTTLPAGDSLETEGQDVFRKIGLNSVNRLAHVSLSTLAPDGPFSPGENLEFDYFITYRDTCLIGEITSRSNPDHVRDKYARFRRHYSFITGLRFSNAIWRTLGVPEDQLRYFRGIRNFKGFFIVTSLQKFDVNLPAVPNFICFYQKDWTVIKEYSNIIGGYAKEPFLHLFGAQLEGPRRPIEIHSDTHSLICTPNKRITSGNIDLADIFTFEASPYELLKVAQVYRRDMLPDINPQLSNKYQRPLQPEKINEIRRIILTDHDFMFPNSILVVLSNDCIYQGEVLSIPDVYGSLSVIDGQHRLFSYADNNIQTIMGDTARLMVTAIKFQNITQEDEVNRYSAKAFIEINTKQTPVPGTHLDSIAYSILGQTTSKALAAHILLQINERRGNLGGLFKTSQTNLGMIQTNTILVALKTITNLEEIRRLQNTRSHSRALIRQGYQNLYECDISELQNVELFIDRSVVCLEHFFNLVANTFPIDWPRRGRQLGSSLEYAKVFSALVRLLKQFINEGLDWRNVQRELRAIRANIMILRRIDNDDALVFDPSDSDNVPNAVPSATVDFHFFNSNRVRPCPISDLMN